MNPYFCNFSLVETNQNLVNRNFLHINMFYYEGPSVVNTMRDLTVGIFKHMNITAKTDIDKRVKNTERVLTRPLSKKYHDILLVYS